MTDKDFPNICTAIETPEDYVFGGETKETDELRLLHKIDGSYVLQRKYVSFIYRARKTDVNVYWEDYPTIEEKDIKK